LGFDQYHESLADGLQVLRYNKTKAYVPHFDWIEDPTKKEEHDFDSERVGSNRFATILLYFTDLTDDAGGQTVFSKVCVMDIGILCVLTLELREFNAFFIILILFSLGMATISR